MNEQSVKISIAIITRNEEAQIRACLESVAWADDIVVVDAHSQDGTRDICAEFTDRVILHPWQGFAVQKQLALDQCRHPWVLSLDADERVRPDLQQQIRRVIHLADACDGYRIARRSYFLGVWIRHAGWYPGYQVRLFRKSLTHVSAARVHEGFIVRGRIGVLPGDLEHYSHPSLENSLAKLNRYSTLEAIDRLQRKRVQWHDFVTHPLGEFARKYIVLAGYRDGLPGFLLSWISALLKMAMYMKIWKMQHADNDVVRRMKESCW